jgi:hypothetical protein
MPKFMADDGVASAPPLWAAVVQGGTGVAMLTGNGTIVNSHEVVPRIKNCKIAWE